MGKEDSIEFIKQILPAYERDLYFHGTSFFLNFPMIDFHAAALLGLAPIGIPKYVKGNVSRLQFNNLANFTTSLLSTPTAPKEISWRKVGKA